MKSASYLWPANQDSLVRQSTLVWSTGMPAGRVGPAERRRKASAACTGYSKVLLDLLGHDRLANPEPAFTVP